MKCTNCGNEIKEGSTFCNNCGMHFFEEKQENIRDITEIPPKKLKKFRITAIIAVVVAVCGIGGFCVWQFVHVLTNTSHRLTNVHTQTEDNEETASRTEKEAIYDVYDQFLSLSRDILIAGKEYEEAINEAESNGWSDIECVPYDDADLSNEEYIPVYGVFTSPEYGDRVTIDWPGGYITSADNMNAIYEKLD